jgi:hypothetical protein
MTVLIVVGACLAGGALIALIALIGARSSRSADRYRRAGGSPWYGSGYNNNFGESGTSSPGGPSWNDSSGPWHNNNNCSSGNSCSGSGSSCSSSSGSSCGSGCGGGGGD